MRVKCYSVRLESFVRISEKAFKALAFDGSSTIIPASQVFGCDYDIRKSDAYWISEWILDQKELQYSHKKIAWFDSETRCQLPTIIVEKHKPTIHKPIENNEITSLKSSSS